MKHKEIYRGIEDKRRRFLILKKIWKDALRVSAESDVLVSNVMVTAML